MKTLMIWRVVSTMNNDDSTNVVSKVVTLMFNNISLILTDSSKSSLRSATLGEPRLRPTGLTWLALLDMHFALQVILLTKHNIRRETETGATVLSNVVSKQ